MAKPVSVNAKNLKALRTRSGLSTRALGGLIEWVHTRVQYYEDEYKKEYLPKDVIELFAPHLIGKGTPPITAEEVFALAGMAPPPLDAESVPHEQSTVSLPIDSPPPLPQRADMPKDVPILGTSVGGSAGEFSMNGEVHDFARRPPGIIDRKDVFAVWVSGESMVPWRKNRELCYVERKRGPSPGDHVVIELAALDGSEERQAFVKKLVRRSATKVVVAQYNPPREIEYDARKIHHIYRVMEWSEVMGFGA